VPQRQIFILLALACALVLRMAVPSGWMPVTDAEGSVVLAPCPAGGPLPMAHGSHDSAPGKQDRHGKGRDCAFAPLQVGIALWDGAEPALPPVPAVPIAAPSPEVSYHPAGPPSPPPPPTGPPTLA
jgi:hypothetical protein